ncbi:MerR family transcriptional regulator [Pectobacterium brasiliense]|uniref:Transcriptional regulator n=2 Tax=Pectobacterium brasiliense TaxID=180957 RepID=A0A0M2EZY6_9GAMM|nr:MerR family transcriptional regulator [Pectobacterium brasiliense]ARA76392.1 helix-turn-helix-type transcriptional regulator [Pectobacterium brasiliense]KFF63598.1 transcriptional regulator [Pectobacterium brasiliense]KGA33993.1 transcriptional regulator [Pectobacterium brasiliense]KHS81700.1 transcriptional regulator [Pectobacterium brasiliense]KHS94460.1 transcriptional regulator [Pectobacterium brasiliense]
MTFYSIGDVAERCGINPVTLRAWQRRYGLLKPQRSEGGHRQFDEADIQRIEEIKRWVESGVPVGKVKALLEEKSMAIDYDWSSLQEEMMTVLRHVRPAKLRTMIMAINREHSADSIIDHLFVPVRQRLGLDQNTSRIMCSMLDGVLIEYAVLRLAETRKKKGEDALLIAWDNDDRTRLWLEAWRLSQQNWNIEVLAEPLGSPRPELFPGQHIFVWTGKATLSHSQNEQLTHWQKQGFAIDFHKT